MGYYNISHPLWFMPGWLLCPWKWVMCRRGYHLFDEALSSALIRGGLEHSLRCDACGLVVGIAYVLQPDEWDEEVE